MHLTLGLASVGCCSGADGCSSVAVVVVGAEMGGEGEVELDIVDIVFAVVEGSTVVGSVGSA